MQPGAPLGSTPELYCLFTAFSGRTFQDGVGLQDEPLRPLLGHLAADGCQVAQDELGALRLPCPRLAAEGKTLRLNPSSRATEPKAGETLT